MRSSDLFTQKCLIGDHKTLLHFDDLIMIELETYQPISNQLYSWKMHWTSPCQPISAIKLILSNMGYA